MTRVRPIAICVFRNHGKILISEAFDSVEGSSFCRPLGGGIEFGETSKQTVIREIQEELGVEITNLRLIGTLENIFTYLGQPGHEIVQVYDGEFVDTTLYHAASIAGIETNGQALEAVWRHIDSFATGPRLVPNGLLELLQRELEPV